MTGSFSPLGVPLVIDASAWHRKDDDVTAERWLSTIRAGLLAACPVALLELRGFARDEREALGLDEIFAGLAQAPVTASACRAALTASRGLGARRRVPAADLLIAAAAAERGFGVIHEDAHFDLLAEVMRFPSVRLSTAA